MRSRELNARIAAFTERLELDLESRIELEGLLALARVEDAPVPPAVPARVEDAPVPPAVRARVEDAPVPPAVPARVEGDPVVPAAQFRMDYAHVAPDAPGPFDDTAATEPGISAQTPAATALATAQPPASAPDASIYLPERYEDLGFLGRGGMGEVRRVRDRQLKRIMAMKIIRAELLERRDTAARFIEEAQATAQLQHPGIVPVHELGQLQDGRVYFTMKEVQGRTLRDAIREVHGLSDPSDSDLDPDGGWTLRRLMGCFHQVCEAVAYAHERGVIHRDLKPSNVMLGAFGEVLVMDWGLARVRGRADAPPASASHTPVETERSTDPLLMTRAGHVAGTPAYMSPEQARGESHRLGPPTDVYSLGAILYEILTGRPPYLGSTAAEIYAQVLQGAPPPVGSRRSSLEQDTLLPAPGSWSRPTAPEALPLEVPVPEDLKQICERAMARDPVARYPDARALTAEVGRWLEGALRRERGYRALKEASSLPGEIRALRLQAASLRTRAATLLSSIRGFEPVDRRKAGWVLEDEAEACEREVDQKELQYLQALRGALMLDPELEEAHEQLADWYRERHEEAETAGRLREAAQLELLLRIADRQGRYASWLRGDGAVSLVTDPPGAEVALFRLERQERRLVERFERSLGRTPLERVSLPRGSYLLRIRAEGRIDVRYPVFIDRGGHWDGVRPGGLEPFPIHLPPIGNLGLDDCYVPAGWYWSGGDAEAYNPVPRRRLWVDGLVVRRFPVTNREYLEFLNDLVARGLEADALRWAPRERSAMAEAGPVIYGRDDRGRFVLRADEDGDVWEAEWPVIMIDIAGALAWAGWESARTGRAWRLPGELEWEKAARGVDARLYPWGSHWDPAWARMAESAEKPRPVPVDSYPDDVSIYGVRGLAGNVRDWCADVYLKEGPEVTGGLVVAPPLLPAECGENRVNRGGDWYGAASGLRCSSRFRMGPSSRYGHVGMRVVRGI